MRIKQVGMLILSAMLIVVLASCNLNLQADTDYESPSDYESMRIEMINEVSDAVVVVENPSDYGSGIIFYQEEIDTTTHTYKYAVLTAYSNITGYLEVVDVDVVLENGQSFEVTEIKSDETYNIAVVYFETTAVLSVFNITQLSGTSVPLVQGQDVYAIGTPYSQTLFNYVSQGILGKLHNQYGNVNDLVFVHSAETNPGMEGAPIFDIDGELIGIQLTKLYMTDDTVDGIPIEGINYALDMNILAPIVLGFDSAFQLSEETPTELSVSNDLNYNDIAKDMIASVTPSIISVIGSGGLGSGIIYKKEVLETGGFRYYVLTNNHVVSSSSEVRIKFAADEDEVAVTDYQANENYDVAVLRVETEEELPVYDIPPINALDYVDIVVGQDVYAIGTPYSTLFHNYATQGIISKLNYTYRGVMNLGLVHEAEINPGNSGGPLFNLNGEVIGVNVAKVVNMNADGDVVYTEGINYSLNINAVGNAISKFTEEGWQLIERSPKLGVTVVNYDKAFDESTGINYPEEYTSGVLVTGFDYTRNAYNVIELFDLIVAVNGIDVITTDELIAELTGKDFGTDITLSVIRIDDQGNVLTLEIVVTLS